MGKQLRLENFREYSFLVDKYIFLEFLFPFLFSLGLFLAITVFSFVLFNLIDLMVQFSIPFSLFFRLFVFSLPEMILYSLPMSVLLASLLTAGRLFRDNEIIIFQLSGRNSFRLFLPIFIFTCFLSVLSIFFNYFVVSKANSQFAKDHFYAQVKRSLPEIKQNIFYKEFEKDILKRAFYASKFNNGCMYNPVVEEFTDGVLVAIINAEKAELNNGNWDFTNGTIYHLEKNTSPNYKSYMNFEKYSFSFSASLEKLATEMRTPKEMNFSELSVYINDLKKSGEKTSALEVQLHQKLAIPLTSVLFFLVGMPLGLNKKSKNASFGFGFSLLFIFSFYILMFTFTALGSINFLNPVFCAWFPDLTVLILGFIFFYKKLQL